MEEERTISEERIARYVELKEQEKAINAELNDIKEEIYALNKESFDSGEYTVTVREQTRMDFNKDNVAKLIEKAVETGLINKEDVENDYIKQTSFKVIRVK